MYNKMVDRNRHLSRIPGVRKVLHSKGAKEVSTSRKQQHSFIAYAVCCMLSLFESIKN